MGAWVGWIFILLCVQILYLVGIQIDMETPQSVSSDNNSTPVYLNIYSFCYCCDVACGWAGLGVYHTAVEVYGIEYMFHGWNGQSTGVSQVFPRTCPYRFLSQNLLGYIEHSYPQFDYQIIQPLRQKFISNRYDLLNNNCNHFALAMCQKLGFGNLHPRGYIFRVTDFWNRCRCCLPNCLLSGRLDWFKSTEEAEGYLPLEQDNQNKISLQQKVQEQKKDEIHALGHYNKRKHIFKD